MKSLREFTDEDIDLAIAKLLRVAVIVSTVTVLVGAVVYLAVSWRQPAAYEQFRLEPKMLRSVRGTVTDARSFDSRGIIQLGLLLLIATPIVRVAFSTMAFAAARDWIYVQSPSPFSPSYSTA